MSRILYILLAAFVTCTLNATETQNLDRTSQKRQKVCLNMIVKNESHVIRRCLDSIKPLIDYWVIVDTGSTDGTQKIIKKHLKGIPGELYERPWKNWGANRTEAFQLAKGKGDYILFMDADDILQFTGDLAFPNLEADQYCMWRGTSGFSYVKPQLVKGNLPWKWVGVTHEYLACDSPYRTDILSNVRYVSCDDGASSKDPKKFLKNVALLEEGLKKEPDNSRYMFYLAESYRDAGEKAKALECYQKRVNMGGWEEEIFWSKLQIAAMLKTLGLPNNICIESYMDAHHYRPHRIEPIYFLAEIYNNQGEYAKAYEIIKRHSTNSSEHVRDTLFNMDWIQEYGLLFQLSICSFYVGRYQDSLEVCDYLIANKNVPESWRECAKHNRTFPIAKLEETIKKAAEQEDSVSLTLAH